MKQKHICPSILALVIFVITGTAQIPVVKPVALDAKIRVGKVILVYAQPVTAKMKISLSELTKPDVDLIPIISKYNLAIRDQAARGTCSVHALTFLMEYAYSKSSTRPGGSIDLSEDFLNYMTNIAVNNTNDGDYFFNINKGYQEYGQIGQPSVPNSPFWDPKGTVPERYIDAAKKITRLKPNVIKENANFTATTVDDADPFGLSDAQFAAVTAELDKGIPVAVGFRWPGLGKFKTENHLGIDMMNNFPLTDLTAGHSIALVGYRKLKALPGGGYFIFRNSWGTDFGNNGYGYMSFAYLKSNAADTMSYH